MCICNVLCDIIVKYFIIRNFIFERGCFLNSSSINQFDIWYRGALSLNVWNKRKRNNLLGMFFLFCFILSSNFTPINIMLFFIWRKVYIFNRFEISWILLSYWIGVSVGKLRNSFQYVQFVAGCMLSFHTKIDFVPIPRFYPLYGIAELYICLGFYSVRFSQILWNLW